MAVDPGTKTQGQLVSLKLDSTDQIHIAYFDAANQGTLEGWLSTAKEHLKPRQSGQMTD